MKGGGEGEGMKSAQADHSDAGPRGRPGRSKKTTWMAAGFLVFLGLDLFLFGNCVIPHQDASPVIVEPGRTRVGAHGLGPIGYPILPMLSLRYGLSQTTDIALSGGFEIFGNSGFAEIDDDGQSFKEGEAMALGFDVKRAILSPKGKRKFTLQGGLLHHSDPWERDDFHRGVSGMAGILFGTDHFHIGVRGHAGMQSVPFYQLELPVGFTYLAFRERLRFQLGVSPSIFIAKGANSIPWPWQYVGLQWDFGGGR